MKSIIYNSMLRLYHYGYDSTAIIDYFGFRFKYNLIKKTQRLSYIASEYKLRTLRKEFRDLGYSVRFELSKGIIRIVHNAFTSEICLDFYQKNYVDADLYETMVELKEFITICNKDINTYKANWDKTWNSFAEFLKENKFDPSKVTLSKDGSFLVCRKTVKYPESSDLKDLTPDGFIKSLNEVLESLKSHGLREPNFQTNTSFIEGNRGILISWLYYIM